MNKPPDPNQLTRSLKRVGIMMLVVVIMAAVLMGIANHEFLQQLGPIGPQIGPIAPRLSK